MIINALHTNGYLYPYNTTDEYDIDLWFEGRSCKDIVEAFNMDARENCGDYESSGMKVSLEYVDGVMDGALDIIKRKKRK